MLTANDGIVKLHTLAYFAHQPEISVSYSIDGNWYTTQNQIPYTCNLDITNMTDGAHTLTIRMSDTVKDYTFYKNGQQIRFGKPFVVAEKSITVLVNGIELQFDQPPIIQDGRTLVPLRAIFEALGAVVSWDGATGTATAARNDTIISIQIGTNEMYKNGAAVLVDVPAQIFNGRTLVPARVIAESFGATVAWDAQTKTVSIQE